MWRNMSIHLEPEEALMDLKVGELWLWVNSTEPDPSDEHKLSAEEGRYLIHKLVEVTSHEITEINDDCIGRRGLKGALAKYGIPEESWPK